jgi:hypothetical protein
MMIATTPSLNASSRPLPIGPLLPENFTTETRKACPEQQARGHGNDMVQTASHSKLIGVLLTKNPSRDFERLPCFPCLFRASVFQLLP